MRALVTGAAAGLARGVAGALARSGSYERVVITFRNTPPDDTLALIRQAGCQASAHRIDFLDDPSAVTAALEAAVRDDGPFDVLVHGVGPMVIARFSKFTLEAYREMFDGNVRSAMLTAAAVLPGMRERRYGRIVVFGMQGSSETRPLRSFSLHLAAKSALVAFARTLALEEAAAGIAVNVIEPGVIRDKELTRSEARRQATADGRSRVGTWEDVADAALFFTSSGNDFITGAVLSVTGAESGAPHEKR